MYSLKKNIKPSASQSSEYTMGALRDPPHAPSLPTLSDLCLREPYDHGRWCGTLPVLLQPLFTP